MSRPVAIVLGAYVDPGGRASRALRRRAAKAADLYAAGVVGRIVASGGQGRHPPSEAQVIRRVLLEYGVPPDAILLEEESRNTLENIRFSSALLPAGTKLVLISDAWHLPRARLVARRLGLDATTAQPSLRGAHPLQMAKSIAREAVAFLVYLLRPLR